ncbi:MAG TPA: class I SAM-dependent methyltransferase [Verrucomicrobiae bacterium]|nr:class I SAM-dependent methyltransferase [Verrucomicrobiae bacterium]
MEWLLILVAVLAVALYVWHCVDVFLSSRPGRVLYVSSSVGQVAPVLDDIIARYIPKTEKVLFIEPGAGIGNVARLMARRYRWKEVQAIDISVLLCFWAKAYALAFRSPLKVFRGNIFNQNYPKGSLVYCYLTSPILERLHKEKKLEGTLVVTLTFAIPGVQATEECSLTNWQGQVYVYDFR